MNKDLDSRWEPELDFCSDLPHFSVPRGFSLRSPLSFDQGVCIGWDVVASWTWDAQDEICGICRMVFDGCCPDCKLPGDNCLLRVNYGMDGIREAD
ncbi:hypothetical protein ACFX2I_023454 [Malus domestica]